MPRGWLPDPRGIFLPDFALQCLQGYILVSVFSGANHSKSIRDPCLEKQKTKSKTSLPQLQRQRETERFCNLFRETTVKLNHGRLGPSFCGAIWLWGKRTQSQQGASQSLLRAWWPLRSVGTYEVYPCPQRTCCSGRLLRSSQKRGLGTL